MSVYMSLRVKADRAKFEQAAGGEWKDRLQEIGERAKSMGAIHHRFAADDGELIVMDEWESREQFERFFHESDDIREFMESVGVQSEPEIRFYEPIPTSDQF